MKRSKSTKINLPLLTIVIVTLLILLPLIGFYFGVTYKQRTIPQYTNQKNNIPSENEHAEDKTIFNFLSNTSSFIKTSQSINFKCYRENSLPTNDSKITQLQEELTNDHRAINTICMNTTNNKVLLASADKVERGDSVNNMLLELLDFNQEKNYTSEYLFKDGQLNSSYFRLLDWRANGDIIFWLEDNNLNRQGSYTIKTYVYSQDSYSSPQLVEYCDIGVGGGTSVRAIRNCKRFTDSNTSLFFKQTALP